MAAGNPNATANVVLIVDNIGRLAGLGIVDVIAGRVDSHVVNAGHPASVERATEVKERERAASIASCIQDEVLNVCDVNASRKYVVGGRKIIIDDECIVDAGTNATVDVVIGIQCWANAVRDKERQITDEEIVLIRDAREVVCAWRQDKDRLRSLIQQRSEEHTSELQS